MSIPFRMTISIHNTGMIFNLGFLPSIDRITIYHISNTDIFNNPSLIIHRYITKRPGKRIYIGECFLKIRMRF